MDGKLLAIEELSKSVELLLEKRNEKG